MAWIPALLNIGQPNLHTLASARADPLAELFSYANMDGSDDTNGSLGRSCVLNFCAALPPIHYTGEHDRDTGISNSSPDLVSIISFVHTHPDPGRLLLVISSPCPACPVPRRRLQVKLQYCCCASFETYGRVAYFRPLRRGGKLCSCSERCPAMR